jgi:hypothetical protein
MTRKAGVSKLATAEEALDGAATWSVEQYLAMDAAYRGRLLDALERGSERMPAGRRREPAWC